MKTSSWFAPKFVQMPINVDGLEFLNPVGISSGWADSPSKIESLHKLGCGIVTSKTITVSKRKGNPRPRIIRSKGQLINSMGLPNNGVDWWVQKLIKYDKHPMILSIKGDTQNEWEELIEKLEKKTDIFELNFSCPNTNEGVMDLKMSTKIIEDISSITKKKIWLKLSPKNSASENLNFVNSVRDKINGITAINTLPVKNNKLGNPRKIGGLSGFPIYKYLIDLLENLRSDYPLFDDLPVFAVGGINSPKRSWEIISDYKSLPLALTAFLLEGPFFYSKIATHINDTMIASDYTSLQQILN